MQGTLSPGALPGLLRALYVGRRTGTLHVTRGDEKRNVRFRHGHIVGAGSAQESEHLGELLLREGWITRDQLDSATRTVKAGGIRLGEALRRAEVLAEERLEEALALHVRHVLQAAFVSSDGAYVFEDVPEQPMDAEMTLQVSTAELILEAVRRLDPDTVRTALGNTNRVLAPSADPLLRFQKVDLTPADGYVLSRVDGVISAREVIEMTGLPAEETERSLYGLLCTGIIEYVAGQVRAARPQPGVAAAPLPAAAAPSAPKEEPAPAAAPSSPATAPAPASAVGEPARRTDAAARRREILEAYDGRGRNHFEVLGLTRAATDQQVKEAYFALAKRFHPDSHHDPDLDDLRDKLEAVFIRVGEAYEKLRNPKTRGQYESDLAAREPRRVPPLGAAAPEPTAPEPPPPPPDPALEARRALEALARAERLVTDQKFFDAIQLLEPVLEALVPKKRARARLVLAAAYARNPNWTRQAENHLKLATADDPKSVEAHYRLGEFYRQQGLKSRAAALFRRVLELEPSHEQAGAGLLEVDVPPEVVAEPARPSLLRRLFGKD